MIMRPRKTPTDSQYKRLLEVRLACPDIRRACNLARAFADLVRHQRGYLLLEWIRQAEQDAPKPMQGFAGFLRQDLDAVTAGLTLGWSSGVVEGHVNRAKTLKRAMYGRASFGLLPARILTLFGADSDGQLADFIASQYADQADALVFACLLHLAEDGSGARFWWRFAAGVGHQVAECCLFLEHAHSGEYHDADYWRTQLVRTHFDPLIMCGDRHTAPLPNPPHIDQIHPHITRQHHPRSAASPSPGPLSSTSCATSPPRCDGEPGRRLDQEPAGIRWCDFASGRGKTIWFKCTAKSDLPPHTWRPEDGGDHRLWGGHMPYRIHFTVDDLARTRIAVKPNPLLELSTAVRQLQCTEHAMRLGAWRREVAVALHPQARMVLDLVPARGRAPGFLVPAGPGTPEELLERVLATPRARVRAELEGLAEHRKLPSWAGHLADDPDTLRRFGDALNHMYDSLLRPYWQRITALTAADSAVRARQVLSGGMEGVLARVNPRRVRWQPPVLEVTMASGLEGDLHLQGRGLLLVPSVFGVDAPVIDPDAEPQPFLTYPAAADRGSAERLLPDVLFGSLPTASRSLAAVLGPTRAAVLTTVVNRPGCSTTELAATVGIAAASASEHAAVLRGAGLLHTVRHGKMVAHNATAAAHALLEASGA
ncbi:transposase [Streptomyces sp. NPDC093060]|uniref:transposase n=1 Tax=Streptomyces sp. NPDC093060 TaxID=3366019 RepID=UPI0037FBF372